MRIPSLLSLVNDIHYLYVSMVLTINFIFYSQMDIFSLSFYALCVSCVYLAFESARPYICYISVSIYLSTVFALIYKRSSTHFLSILSWSSVWTAMNGLLALRDFGVVLDISIVSGVCLLGLLCYGVVSSCYIIMGNSRNWYENIFSIASLHWVVFHDSYSWIKNAKPILAVPIIIMVLVRCVYYYDIGKKTSVYSNVVLLLLLVFEILLIMEILNFKLFYMVAGFLFGSLVLLTEDVRHVYFICLAPFALPIVFGYALINTQRYGFYTGLERTWVYCNNTWNTYFEKDDSITSPYTL